MPVRATVCLTDEYLTGQQWSSVAQRSKMHQVLNTQAKVVSRMNSVLVFYFSWDLLTFKKMQNIISSSI